MKIQESVPITRGAVVTAADILDLTRQGEREISGRRRLHWEALDGTRSYSGDSVEELEQLLGSLERELISCSSTVVERDADGDWMDEAMQINIRFAYPAAIDVTGTQDKWVRDVAGRFRAEVGRRFPPPPPDPWWRRHPKVAGMLFGFPIGIAAAAGLLSAGAGLPVIVAVMLPLGYIVGLVFEALFDREDRPRLRFAVGPRVEPPPRTPWHKRGRMPDLLAVFAILGGIFVIYEIALAMGLITR